MTRNTFAALSAALTALVAVSTASAAQPAPAGAVFQCRRQWTPSHTRPVVVHCNARTSDGTSLFRPAHCDPAVMSEAAMRADCKVAVAGQPGAAG